MHLTYYKPEVFEKLPLKDGIINSHQDPNHLNVNPSFEKIVSEFFSQKQMSFTESLSKASEMIKIYGENAIFLLSYLPKATTIDDLKLFTRTFSFIPIIQQINGLIFDQAQKPSSENLKTQDFDLSYSFEEAILKKTKENGESPNSIIRNQKAINFAKNIENNSDVMNIIEKYRNVANYTKIPYSIVIPIYLTKLKEMSQENMPVCFAIDALNEIPDIISSSIFNHQKHLLSYLLNSTNIKDRQICDALKILLQKNKKNIQKF